MPTTEYRPDRTSYQIEAAFQASHNWPSIEDHSKLVLNGTKDKPTRYHGILNADYKTACREIWRGGYATNPKYPQLLMGIIEQYGLMKYDERGKKTVMSAARLTGRKSRKVC